ncbi:uncharacterized protein [Setaria viridis]|uniref:Uncharacterized protein n=1 Tax=Setaria viridis TaxID=4556 RepID=A0A4U6UVX3_SETVI|nr:uncharacterized protein LOC117854153 [Setaria viridis]TKW20821.1 hypothetical protein SEVIR_4G114100v2 [Setaria viridis]
MPEIFLPSYEEHLQRISLEGSFASPWASSPYAERLFPIEHDLISKLQVPKVIKPHPSRPKNTTIYIDYSNIDEVVVSKKTPREVEAELEVPNTLPAIISGGNNNRAHLMNDAYKEMVGQPLCQWLDSLPGADASRRINGKVVLYAQKFSTVSYMPSTRCVFPCTTNISWEDGDATTSLIVPCAVEHLTSSPNEYCFIRRFDSRKASIMYSIA